MSVMPPSFTAAGGGFAEPRATPTDVRWAALHEAAGLVAALAGIELAADRDAEDFPALFRGAEGWRRALAEQGVADLAAIMEPGIEALLAVNARGADPQPAARALWREFTAARAAIVELLPTG